METKTIAEQFPWAVAGAPAFIYEQGSWGYRSLTPTIIKSVTKTRINLENGRSFYVPKWGDSLKEVGVDRYRSSQLVSSADPVVAETRAAIRKQKIENDARAAAEAFNRSRTVDNAHTAVQALNTFIKANKEEAN